MVRQKDAGPAGGTGRSSAAQRVRKRNRHYNDRDHLHVPSLVARPALPKSKHKTILEWTENTDKKRKLEIEFTTNKNPNANFSFVPIGNPELTSMCKELSREEGALVYIVSTTKEKGTDLSDHVHRVGYHFRTIIVEQATNMLDSAQSIDLADGDMPHTTSGNKPDPIPESQEEINKQADAAIRDLFPRIPNTDREMIVRHAFQKGAVFNGKPVVGLQADLTLSRRVQLAVIAHIRHTHTRYDLLLRETSWENARKTVESLCLDILVKWRGDEETGRDQLDEVLREIVVIDDSDNGTEDESDEESASNDEEVDNSNEITNGVAGVDLGITTVLPASFPEQLPESQPKEIALAQKRNGSQLPSRVNSLHQSYGIASRTRSKKKPNHRQKAKKSRKNKRLQAWQDALRRRGEPHSALKTPLEQNARTDSRSLGESSRLILNRTPVGQNSADLYTVPYNDDYQTIYVIDNSQGPSKSVTYLPSSLRITGPSNFNYRERMLINPQKHDTPTMDHRQAYDKGYSPNKPLPFRTSTFQQSYASSNRDIPSKDLALPSIENHIDMVMYEGVEPERKYIPAHTDATYVSGRGDNQPKRRRLVLADDQTHVPLSSSTADSYVRLVPISRPEQSPKTMASSRRAIETRDGGDRRDVPIIIDERPGYPRYVQRVGESREQPDYPIYIKRVGETREHYGASTIPNLREPVGVDRERRLVVDDDSSPRLLMVRRRPEPHQAYPGHQYVFESQNYENRRTGDQHYFEPSRITQSMQDPLNDHNSFDNRNQSGQPVLYARAPQQYHHDLAHGSSTSLSTFPSHPHPHPREGNSGLVPYPIISRLNHDYDSRFPFIRNEPVLVAAKTSHQIQHERLAGDAFERPGQQHKEEPHRVVDFEAESQAERRYIAPGSSDRRQKFDSYHTLTGPPEIVSGTMRKRPTNATGMNESMDVRELPYRDEVIVLSP